MDGFVLAHKSSMRGRTVDQVVIRESMSVQDLQIGVVETKNHSTNILIAGCTPDTEDVLLIIDLFFPPVPLAEFKSYNQSLGVIVEQQEEKSSTDVILVVEDFNARLAGTRSRK